MKLSEKQLLQLQNAIEVTKLMGIESVMVSEGKIRGSKHRMMLPSFLT